MIASADFRRLPVAVWLAALLLAAACSSGSQNGQAVGQASIPPGPLFTTTTTASSESDPLPSDLAPSDLASLITELPAATIGAPEPPAAKNPPVALRISSLGVEAAPVLPVGLDAIGDMEVPPADEVGWYRYGPTPGDQGSSVLAAHIAYDGSDGVFVNLDQIEIGSSIEVGYADGTIEVFEATDIRQYTKTELPRDSVFERTGDPRLVLITCGGDFNSGLRSYEDNVVVYAEPIA